MCSSLLLRNQSDPFLDRIVTCDEKWILYDNRRRSAQWLDFNEAPKPFPKPKLHQKSHGNCLVVHTWFNPLQLLKTRQNNYSGKVLSANWQNAPRTTKKRPALLNRKGPILLHDNARPHVARKTMLKLNELGYETLPHPPYSPDLSPTDYHLFKHFSQFLREKCFRNQGDAERALDDFIASRTPEFYETGIKKLVTRWQQCVQCNGFYFD